MNSLRRNSNNNKKSTKINTKKTKDNQKKKIQTQLLLNLTKTFSFQKLNYAIKGTLTKNNKINSKIHNILHRKFKFCLDVTLSKLKTIKSYL